MPRESKGFMVDQIKGKEPTNFWNMTKMAASTENKSFPARFP